MITISPPKKKDLCSLYDWTKPLNIFLDKCVFPPAVVFFWSWCFCLHKLRPRHPQNIPRTSPSDPEGTRVAKRPPAIKVAMALDWRCRFGRMRIEFLDHHVLVFPLFGGPQKTNTWNKKQQVGLPFFLREFFGKRCEKMLLSFKKKISCTFSFQKIQGFVGGGCYISEWIKKKPNTWTPQHLLLSKTTTGANSVVSLENCNL